MVTVGLNNNEYTFGKFDYELVIYHIMTKIDKV